MNKLIKSELFRIKNSGAFLSSIIIIFIITIFICITQYNYIKTGSTEVSYNIIWFFSAFIGFFIAIFTSLHVGSDFSDRTINYKIISGYSRPKIYLSYLITCIIEGLMCLFTYIFIILCIILFGKHSRARFACKLKKPRGKQKRRVNYPPSCLT